MGRHATIRGELRRGRHERTMTRKARHLFIGLGAIVVPIVLLVGGAIGVAAAWPEEPMPDFRAYEAGPDRKTEFFEFVRPLVAAENERIRRDRERLTDIVARSAHGWFDRWWLSFLAQEYRIDEASLSEDEVVETLLRRVDVVPMSLALAQAAKESGWGTSRFARDGNNLFGEWCFDSGCGIVPQNRAQGRRHEVEAFSSPRDSVISYLRNLNTHDRYHAFRIERARLRETGSDLSGWRLAEELTGYSERRDDYVEDIQSLIRVNKLADEVAPLEKQPSPDAGG